MCCTVFYYIKHEGETMDKDYYINIQSFMVQDLKLSGNELLTYAIVYGFSQDGESLFLGSSKYVSYALGVSRTTAIKALDSLTAKGLIIKIQEKINDVVFNRYKVSLQAIQKLDRGYTETVQGGYTETVHSNKYKDINIKNNKEIYVQVVDLYNETCVSFPKVTTLSERRKKAIRARLNTHTMDDIKRCFEMAEQSDFLKGKNNRDWQANFDWMMNDNNMAKILDGNYINRDKRKEAQHEVKQEVEEKSMSDFYNENGDFDLNGYLKYCGYKVEDK